MRQVCRLGKKKKRKKGCQLFLGTVWHDPFTLEGRAASAHGP